MYVDLVVTAPLVFVCRRIAKRVIPGVPIKSIGGHVLTRKESLPLHVWNPELGKYQLRYSVPLQNLKRS